jgi:hypothetical protein
MRGRGTTGFGKELVESQGQQTPLMGIYIERGGRPDRSSLRTHPSLVFERDCARTAVLLSVGSLARPEAEANGCFCKQTECPLGNRHHLMLLGAAHSLRLLKNSERGPQKVESVEEVKRVETVKIACLLKEESDSSGLGRSLRVDAEFPHSREHSRAVHAQERGNATTVRLAFERLAPPS